MNTCPDIGVWRAWLDHEEHPLGLAEHLPGCPACQRLIADLRDDADAVSASVATLGPARLPSPADVAVARERFDWRRAREQASVARREPAGASQSRSRRLGRLPTPWRVAAGGLAAALAVAFIGAFTPQGSSAAAAFLAQFRSQQVTAVEITPQTQGDIVRSLNALSNLGTVQMPGSGTQTQPQAVARSAAEQSKVVSLSEAAQSVGFPLRQPDPTTLPAGVPVAPRVRLIQGTQVRFTFDKNKARAYYQSIGHPEVSLPDRFDGASLAVTLPSAALLEYGCGAAEGGGENAATDCGGSRSAQALVVAEAGELVVDVQGNVSLTDMRDFLLGLPGLPPSVVSQLKQIQNWNNTLPVPVPVDQVHWQSTTIGGNQGLLLNDNSGVASAAVWHADGHLFGVAGSIKATDLKRVADSLAVR
ncbi:MAG TPA: hypothetical protein VF937_00900 [Chloroflexota bacterium]